MIQLPRRSVTRFFIPLIDVLTLLFCIFLLMPLIKATGETQNATGQESPFADSQSPKRLPVERPITSFMTCGSSPALTPSTMASIAAMELT